MPEEKTPHGRGKEQEALFNWDHSSNPEVLLVRKMLHGGLSEIREVLEEHSRDRLKDLFLRKIHLFRRHNRSFWKLVLEVSDKAQTLPSESLEEGHLTSLPSSLPC